MVKSFPRNCEFNHLRRSWKLRRSDLSPWVPAAIFQLYAGNLQPSTSFTKLKSDRLSDYLVSSLKRLMDFRVTPAMIIRVVSLDGVHQRRS